MKMPKEIKLYCKRCGRHTIHVLKEYKKKQPRGLSWGNRRKRAEKLKGYGANKIKAHKVTQVYKQNKRPTFIAICKECGHKTMFSIDKRMKRVELTTVYGH
jgi:ribosomal protein L44E